MMNRNGITNNNSNINQRKSSLINIGSLIETIDDDGNWCQSEVVNIIENKLIVKFLKPKDPSSRLFDLSSDKWRLIATGPHKNTRLSLTNNNNNDIDDFKKGDCVLAKWHDGNYYLSQILDISTKTKFGTKIKEYHIVYLYDNVEETVPVNRLKSTDNIDFNQSVNKIKPNRYMSPVNVTSAAAVSKRPYRKRGLIDSIIESEKSNNSSDNVFYDEKTKKFTENCKIRRLRLSQIDGEKDNKSNYRQSSGKIGVRVNENNTNSNRVGKSHHERLLPVKPNRNSSNNNSNNNNSSSNSNPRLSQRSRRSSFRKADYFYPDSVEQHSATQTVVAGAAVDRGYKSSNNVSRVSTPLIHHESVVDDGSRSPKHFAVQITSDQKDLIASSNHSPISVSLTSNDESPKQKPKLESFHPTELEIQGLDSQAMFSCNEDGQYLCLICTNKTFRKKKLVLEHIKYYHSNECQLMTTNPVKHSPQSSAPQTVHRTRYSPNKRYYSSYLKTNRSSFERKKHFSKLNKTKYKPFINRSFWNTNRNNTIEKSSEFSNFSSNVIQSSIIDNTDLKIIENPESTYLSSSSFRKQSTSIVYCHRCKKSTEDGCLVQCDLCLCWSHTSCYGLSDHKDSSNFWECDNCANVLSNDGKKTLEWHRDRWRFYSVLQNELPWMSKSSSSKYPSSLKNICEMQSLLSLSQRVLEAIIRSLDKLVFKVTNDSNSQDDLDYLKTLHMYDNIDDLPRLETLDLNINNDNEEIFKLSSAGKTNSINCISNIKVINSNLSTNTPNFQFNDMNFSNSTPIKVPTNGNKSVNTSLDGILDCDIQKLEFLPKADFDALVKDLHSCEDIYKKTNIESNPKSILLDLFDDNCNINNPNKPNEVHVSLDPDMPFSQPTSLYQSSEIINPTESIIYLSNDELTSMLLEKETQKDITLCEELCDFDGHILSTNKYPSRESLGNSCSDFESKTTDLIASTSSFDQSNFHKSKPSKEINKKLIIRSDSKLEIEFSDLHAIIQPESTNINDPGTSSAYADAELGLSQSDSRCLQWLLCKFKCVEKVVEAVESALQSSESSASSDCVSSSSLESDYSRLSKYLQSLLYILKKNQCQ